MRDGTKPDLGWCWVGLKVMRWVAAVCGAVKRSAAGMLVAPVVAGQAVAGEAVAAAMTFAVGVAVFTAVPVGLES